MTAEEARVAFLEWLEHERRSAPLTVEAYRGDLAAFLPYLRAARWTGVGRQTVWGKGEIEVAE